MPHYLNSFWEIEECVNQNGVRSAEKKMLCLPELLYTCHRRRQRHPDTHRTHTHTHTHTHTSTILVPPLPTKLFFQKRMLHALLLVTAAPKEISSSNARSDTRLFLHVTSTTLAFFARCVDMCRCVEYAFSRCGHRGVALIHCIQQFLVFLLQEVVCKRRRVDTLHGHTHKQVEFRRGGGEKKESLSSA